MERKGTGFGHGCADLTWSVYIIVICSKWGGLLSHEVVTTTRKLGGDSPMCTVLL